MDDPSDIGGLLRRSPLFVGADAATIRLVATRCTRQALAPGECLMTQGETAEAAYIVVRGRLRVSVRTAGGGNETVGEIGRGDIVGEMALLTDEPRSATARAVRETEVLVIDARTFSEVMATHPATLRTITTRLVHRLRRTITRTPPATPVTAVTMVGLARDVAPALAHDLAEAMRRRGRSTACVSAADAAGRDDLDTWMRTVEAAHDVVVLVVDGDDLAWARRGVETSDLVLLAAAGAAAPTRRDVESAVWDLPTPEMPVVDLVLLYERGRPGGTGRWYPGRDLRRHFHLRPHLQADHDRLARAVLGEEVTLVLSGGGAKGLAHIGVYRVMQELGVAIDAVGGASAGAIIAAGVADQWPADAVRDMMHTQMVLRGSALDMTFPSVSLARGARITERLQAAMGDRAMEDTWIDLFCVSTNLSRALPHVHRHGPLWRAVRASVAVPGVFPPVPDGDDLLVDGGVVDNLPVGTMRHLHDGATVIAVDVGSSLEITSGALPDSGVVNGWRLLAGRMTPFTPTPDVTGIMRILMRITELSSKGGDRGDLTIVPAVADVGLFEFDRLDELVERGASAAEPALRQWLAR
jgi:NTE family protein